MSLYEEDDFNNSELDVSLLDEKEQGGYLVLPAYAVFCDLAAPGQYEDYDPKWQLTFRLPKNADSQRGFTWGSLLFAVCGLIGEKTWKGDAEEKMDSIWGCIENGIAPKNSDISIQDGDLHKPEHNAGFWVVKASRRLDEGPPTNIDIEGNPIVVFDDDGELIEGVESEVVRNGDYCMILLRVWAQKKRERLNFTLDGVRLVKRGAGMRAANEAKRKEAIGQLMGTTLPAIPESFGDGDDDSGEDDGMNEDGSIEAEVVKPNTRKKAASKKASSKKAPSKKAASKKASSKKASSKKASTNKKKGSVFRKKRGGK